MTIELDHVVSRVVNINPPIAATIEKHTKKTLGKPHVIPILFIVESRARWVSGYIRTSMNA